MSRSFNAKDFAKQYIKEQTEKAAKALPKMAGKILVRPVWKASRPIRKRVRRMVVKRAERREEREREKRRKEKEEEEERTKAMIEEMNMAKSLEFKRQKFKREKGERFTDEHYFFEIMKKEKKGIRDYLEKRERKIARRYGDMEEEVTDKDVEKMYLKEKMDAMNKIIFLYMVLWEGTCSSGSRRRNEANIFCDEINENYICYRRRGCKRENLESLLKPDLYPKVLYKDFREFMENAGRVYNISISYKNKQGRKIEISVYKGINLSNLAAEARDHFENNVPTIGLESLLTFMINYYFKEEYLEYVKNFFRDFNEILENDEPPIDYLTMNEILGWFDLQTWIEWGRKKIWGEGGRMHKNKTRRRRRRRRRKRNNRKTRKTKKTRKTRRRRRRRNRINRKTRRKKKVEC